MAGKKLIWIDFKEEAKWNKDDEDENEAGSSPKDQSWFECHIMQMTHVWIWISKP